MQEIKLQECKTQKIFTTYLRCCTGYVFSGHLLTDEIFTLEKDKETLGFTPVTCYFSAVRNIEIHIKIEEIIFCSIIVAQFNINNNLVSNTVLFPIKHPRISVVDSLLPLVWLNGEKTNYVHHIQ